MEIGWTSFLFLGIAILLLWKFSQYLRGELKIAPQKTFMEKLKVNLSIIIFSAVLTATILFIMAIISSAIASNASIAISETNEINEQLIERFTWPTLLPIILVALGVYISIYPLFEIMNLGRGSQDGAMEMQKWLENTVIDRFRPPWSYIVAFIIYVLFYIVPPAIISYIMVIVLKIPYDASFNMSALTMTTFIFLGWFMIMPVMYLTYYASIGSSQAFFSGLKANLRKDKVRLVYFIFSIFSIISVVTNLIIYVPYLFDPTSLEPAVPGETTGLGGFIQDVISYFVEIAPWATAQDKENWYNFIQIVPLDFLMFFIITCIFSILGFYAKFLNKEPLNRPVLVFFAAYIVSGIAFQVFVNIITKWPWALPSENIWLDLSQYDSDPTVLTFMQLFIPAMVVDKIFTAIFYSYQLFFNKNLKETINETVLTQAIADQDIDVLKKYTKDKNPRIRKMVAEAVLHIVESNPIPEDTAKMIPIFEDLIVDHEPMVVRAIAPAIRVAAFRIPTEKLYLTIQLGFGTEEEVNIAEMQKLIVDIGKHHPERMQPLYEKLYSGYVPDKVKEALMEIIHTLGKDYPELSYNIAMPMLERKNTRIRRRALWIVKNLIYDFQPKYDQIYNKMKQFAMNKHDPLRGNAIEIMGYIASRDQDYVDLFLKDYRVLEKLDLPAKQKIVGGLTQLVVSYPEMLDEVLPEIVQPLEERKESPLVADIIMSLGVISINLDAEDYLTKIGPILQRVSNRQSHIAKTGSINTFRFLFKAREDFLAQSQSQQLIVKYLLDDIPEIRDQTAEIVKTLDNHFALKLLIKALSLTNDPSKIRDLLKSLNQFLDEQVTGALISEEGLLDRLFNLLTTQDTHKQNIRLLITKILIHLSNSSVSIAEKAYPTLREIINFANDQSGGLTLKFIGQMAIQLKVEPSAYDVDLDYEEYYAKVINFLSKLTSDKKQLKDEKDVYDKHIAAAEVLQLIYEVDSSKQDEIFDVYYSLRKSKSDEIISIVIKMLSQIACDFPAVYFKYYEMEYESRWIDQSRLEGEVLPIIYNNISTRNKDVQDSIINAMSLITDTFGSSEVIKKFLFKTIRRKAELSTKITIIGCLTRIKDAELDKHIVKRLTKLTRDRMDETIRETALRGLAALLLKFDSPETYDPSEDKDKLKAFKRIKNSLLRRWYKKDNSVFVRKAYIEEITDIAIKFPELKGPMNQVKEYAMDDSQEVAIMAVKSYFEYIDAHPDKLKEISQYMRYFANTSDVGIKNILLNELINHYRSGEDLRFYLPTLLKLAVDKDKTIRKKSLNIFKEIYEKTTEKLLFFMELLIKLTRDKDPRIRVDAFELVAQLTFEFPKNIKQQNLVFDTFYRLSRDYDLSVKRAVSQYLEDLVKIFPERVKNVQQMIYNLLREKDRTIIKNCANALRYVLFLHPEMAEDVKPIVIRFFRRNANPYLESLIRDFDNFE